MMVLKFFEYKHLPARLQAVSRPLCEMAEKVYDDLKNTEDQAELAAGLRKLLEAKDCFVRAQLGMPK